MKLLVKTSSIILCLCLCVVVISGCSFSQESPGDDWYDGYEDGYEDGFDKGYHEAELEYEDEYLEGYNDGNNDGYYAGATYTCIFFGDVDRAFQSAYKGSAWGTFIDAYDQYISNIYDDSETKSKLFWAFVSVKSGNGLTEEERDVLLSTFGKEFFARNDIELKIG